MRIRYDMVSCFVIRRAASGGWEFLQVRRRADDFLGGTWQTVYGTAIADESPDAAALRELHEEVGVAPAEFYKLSDAPVFYISAHDTLWHCVQYCAVLKPDDAIKLNDEHDAARWLKAEEAAEQFMWPGDRRAVGEIRGQIIGDGIAKQYMRVT